MTQSTIQCIALISNDIISQNMAGPGIRYWEFAKVLGQYFSVKLIIPPFVKQQTAPQNIPIGVTFINCTSTAQLTNVVLACDMIISFDIVLFLYPVLTQLNKLLVIDLYDPFLLEDLQRQAENDYLTRLSTHQNFLTALHKNLRLGDFFICAGEKQRDYWLGVLSALGRINPYTYDQDQSLRSLIDVLPFGLPQTPPQHTQAVLKGVYEGIAKTDKVILWTGGVWEWFDTLTLIKAMALVVKKRKDVKLFFMGVKRPNHGPKQMKTVKTVIALSKDLGLYNKFVFFNDWVAYDERQNYLLEADIGVSLHQDHIETRFSFRTRLLDHLWAALPTVSTQGDVLGEMMATYKLAYLVEPGDVEGVAQQILKLLELPNLRGDHAPRFEQVTQSYHWSTVMQPLLRFCTNPTQAADKGYIAEKQLFGELPILLQLPLKASQALKLGGVSGLVQQGKEYLRWKFGR